MVLSVFIDFFTDDHNRVILSKVGNQNFSDYINASYITACNTNTITIQSVRAKTEII